jgi:uncharacterized membrane protein YcaP (DUF421 family)
MDPIAPFDLTRMVFGDAPPLFYAEIVVRCLLIYGWTLILLRWVGGRSIAQLSLVEFLLVIALGSAVGDSMYSPQVPLMHALAVITVIVLISKAIDVLTLRSRRLYRIVDGTPILVIRDGVVQKQAAADSLGLPELASMLRLAGIGNLGAVRAAYLEPSGLLSVFPADPPRPGLRIEPPGPLEPLPPALDDSAACCTGCGWCTPGAPPLSCPNCAGSGWTPPCHARRPKDAATSLANAPVCPN